MEMARASDNLTLRITDPASGLVYEIPDVPFDRIGQIRAQFAQNGHTPDSKRPISPDYEGFKKSLSVNARKFLQILRDNPSGITADHLADKMGFKSGTQMGGMTGGGIKKNANKFGLELTDIYRLEVSFHEGRRIVLYRPGKEIAKVQ